MKDKKKKLFDENVEKWASFNFSLINYNKKKF